MWIVMMSLAGCSTTSLNVSSYCEIYKPVYYKKDSISDAQALDAIRKNNYVYLKQCLKKDLPSKNN